jgi:hypothetical protein
VERKFLQEINIVVLFVKLNLNIRSIFKGGKTGKKQECLVQMVFQIIIPLKSISNFLIYVFIEMYLKIQLIKQLTGLKNKI